MKMIIIALTPLVSYLAHSRCSLIFVITFYPVWPQVHALGHSSRHFVYFSDPTWASMMMEQSVFLFGIFCKCSLTICIQFIECPWNRVENGLFPGLELQKTFRGLTCHSACASSPQTGSGVIRSAFCSRMLTLKKTPVTVFKSIQWTE